ncbi:MAG: RNA polymerase sigma factor [bacterium]|nr:RNA polymerase sigma factor [bacterium]
MSSEKQLIEQLKRGESSAVRAWFALYHDRLLAYVSSRVGDLSDCEELTQEVFLHALKQLPLFRGSSTLWTWMISIARHEVADFYRKRFAKKALQTLPLAEQLFSLPLEDSDEVSRVVLLCLSRMRAYSAELLRLKYIDKKRVADIGRELGKSVKAIESELFRARGEFRELYAVVLKESSQ